MNLSSLLKSKDACSMKKITIILSLFALLFAHSDFLRANTQEDCFDAAGLITVGKYLDFQNAVASSSEDPRQPDGDLMCEVSQEKRGAPMLGLSREEAMQYCHWVEHGDDQYDLISNNDGSFSLVKNENENETSSPLMMGGMFSSSKRPAEQPAGDNRIESPMHEEGDVEANSDGSEDNQMRGSLGTSESPQENNNIFTANNNPSTGQPTVNHFVQAALLSHASNERLVVRGSGDSERMNLVFAKSKSMFEQGSRDSDTRKAFKAALEMEYGTRLVNNSREEKIPGTTLGEVYSTPLDSLRIFQAVLMMERRSTRDALNKSSSLKEAKFVQYAKRKEAFKNAAIEFAKKVTAFPKNEGESMAGFLERLAKQCTGSTTLEGPFGCGATLDNHDTAVAVSSVLRYFSDKNKRLAGGIAAHAIHDYERLVNKAKESGFLQDRVLNVLDDVKMSNGTNRTLEELKSLWTNSFSASSSWLENSQAVPIWSYRWSRANLLNGIVTTEYLLTERICEGQVIPRNVQNVFRATYSIRNNVSEIKRWHVLPTSAQIYVERSNRRFAEIDNDIQEYSACYGTQHNGDQVPNAQEWLRAMNRARAAAEQAKDTITTIHNRNGQG